MSVSAGALPPRKSDETDDTSMTDGKDRFLGWGWREKARMAEDWVQLADDQDEAGLARDPYSLVLFNDIRPFLFVVKTPSLLISIPHMFIGLLGLPLLHTEKLFGLLRSDNFLARHLMPIKFDNDDEIVSSMRRPEVFLGDVQNGFVERMPTRNSRFPVKSFYPSLISLGPSTTWFGLIEKLDYALERDFVR